MNKKIILIYLINNNDVKNEFVLRNRISDKFRLVLATTLREDGYPDGGDWNAIEQEGGSRADSFEYVMSGKVYRIEGDDLSNEPGSRLNPWSDGSLLVARIYGGVTAGNELLIKDSMECAGTCAPGVQKQDECG
ncbi:hypothetical protein KQX54_021652 [Cotesia glomerata]|uniref:Uncharacterized protein n=1 Tax=Cotesia glomerata TaxID=32391 RepID=A0AAV7IWL8_COTGL|nr:hypothetical protein KQX54_021652 [Cotesia glomerata]